MLNALRTEHVPRSINFSRADITRNGLTGRSKEDRVSFTRCVHRSWSHILSMPAQPALSAQQWVGLFVDYLRAVRTHAPPGPLRHAMLRHEPHS